MAHRVLLADDSLTIQRVIEMTFSNEGFEVIAVSNGKEALEALLGTRPDLILADANMPFMDGYELCKIVKSMPGFSNIPVLFLNGAYEEFDRERAEAAGMDGYVTKPFDSRRLIERVRQLVAGDAAESARPSDAQTTELEREAILESIDPFADLDADAEADADVDAAFAQAFEGMTDRLARADESSKAPAAGASPFAGRSEPDAADLEADAAVEAAFAAFDGEDDEEDDDAPFATPVKAPASAEVAVTAPVAVAPATSPVSFLEDEDDEAAASVDHEFEGEIDAALDGLTDFDLVEEPSRPAVAAAVAPAPVTPASLWQGASEPERPREPQPVMSFLSTDDDGEEDEEGDFVFGVEDDEEESAGPSFATAAPIAAPAAPPPQAPTPAPSAAVTPQPAPSAPAVAATIDPQDLEEIVEQKLTELLQHHLDALLENVAERLSSTVASKLGEVIRGMGIEESARMIVEKVAWDVVPDLAEVVVREEIRQIKLSAGLN